MGSTQSPRTVNTLVEQGKIATQLLRDISEVINLPYLNSIAGASVLLLDKLAVVRAHKAECTRITEQVCAINSAIVNICHEAEFDLAPCVLYNIATFSETLKKVLSYVRRQVEGDLIRRVVRYLKDPSLLSECQAALDHAIRLFKLESSVITLVRLAQIDALLVKNHSELLMLAKARESSTTVQRHIPSPWVTSNFHGRDKELQHVVSQLLYDEPARVALLGPGGVGKSCLSLAVLYHPDIVVRFGSERHFISCESAQSANYIAVALLRHFSQEIRDNPTHSILNYLSNIGSPALIVLDNLETSWEPLINRSVIEDFLSRLSEIDTLDLIITMRGEERPGNIRWTRPFLLPLSPLSNQAAKQVFYDMTDAAENDRQVDLLLSFTDNLPLAVTLMASLVSFEGAALVLDRWKSERISILSEGIGKRSNLSTSIMMSLNSPRLTAVPDALTLLSLLSVLPDGLDDWTLRKMGVPLADVPLCRVTLCRTSVAYVSNGRLKVLVPIREYMRATYPPLWGLVSPLLDFFYDLVRLFDNTWGRDSPTISKTLVQRVSAGLGNINSLLQLSLESRDPPPTQSISCIMNLAKFTGITGIGSYDMLQSISGIVQTVCDKNTQGEYFLTLYRLPVYEDECQEEGFLNRALRCFEEENNISAQGSQWGKIIAMANTILSRTCFRKGNVNDAYKICSGALRLARQSDDHSVIATVLEWMSNLLQHRGNLRQAWVHTIEAQGHAQATGDLKKEYRCMMNRTVYCMKAGNFRRACALDTDLDPFAKLVGMEKGVDAISVMNLNALIHGRKSEFVEAREITANVVEMTRDQKTMRLMHLMVPLHLAYYDAAIGTNVDPDSIHACAVQFPPDRWTSYCDRTLAFIFERRGELQKSHDLLQKCLTASRGKYSEEVNACFRNLGDNMYARSDVSSAAHYFALHLVMSHNIEDYEGMHQRISKIREGIVANSP
ncbi:hypothetical protein C8R44DRAFT_845140 [Mycena epipterygia]|nr:hypothetical protein C8R44DRAFT_845140 [Mycena epipterygia]